MADISEGLYDVLEEIFTVFLSAMVSFSAGILEVVVGIPQGDYFSAPVTIGFLFAFCLGLYMLMRRNPT